MRVLFIVHMNNVESVAALNEVAGPTLRQTESRLFELGNRTAAPNPSNRTAIFCTGGVFGILSRQFRKVSAGFNLLQDVFSFFSCGFDTIRIDFAVGIW